MEYYLRSDLLNPTCAEITFQKWREVCFSKQRQSGPWFDFMVFDKALNEGTDEWKVKRKKVWNDRREKVNFLSPPHTCGSADNTNTTSPTPRRDLRYYPDRKRKRDGWCGRQIKKVKISQQPGSPSPAGYCFSFFFWRLTGKFWCLFHRWWNPHSRTQLYSV